MLKTAFKESLNDIKLILFLLCMLQMFFSESK